MPQPVKPAKNVTNNSNRTIAIGATEIAPGSTARIPNYDRLRSAVVIIWEEQNIISVGAAERAVMPAAVPPQMPGAPVMPPQMPGMPPMMPGAPPADPELAEKEQIIAELATLGINKTTRTGLENLRLALAQAKAG